jgi:HSF-type DNA-binding
MIDEDEEPDADYEQAFPARLHYLLDVLEKDGLAHVCSFQSHGRAFVVRDKEAFVKDILPKYVDWVSLHSHVTFSSSNVSHSCLLYLSYDRCRRSTRWFRQNRWASFQRQLNHYEFKRITAGTFHSPCFLFLTSPRRHSRVRAAFRCAMHPQVLTKARTTTRTSSEASSTATSAASSGASR